MRYLPILLAMLFALPAFGQSTWPAGKVVYSNSDNVEDERDVHQEFAHASLPTCDAAAKGTTAYINDGSAAGTCSPGASVWVLCTCDDNSTWVAVGGGGGGSGDIESVGSCLGPDCFTSGSPDASIFFNNATSGTIELQAVTGALGSSVVQIPAHTSTLITEESLVSALTSFGTNPTLDGTIALTGAQTFNLGGLTTTWDKSGSGVQAHSYVTSGGTATLTFAGTGVTFSGAINAVGTSVIQGGIQVLGSATTDGELQIFNDIANTRLSIKSADGMAGFVDLVFPPNDGDADQGLHTDGGGILSWVDDDAHVHAGVSSVSVEGVSETDPNFTSDGDLDVTLCTAPSTPFGGCVLAGDILYRYGAGSIGNLDISGSANIQGSKVLATTLTTRGTVEMADQTEADLGTETLKAISPDTLDGAAMTGQLGGTFGAATVDATHGTAGGSHHADESAASEGTSGIIALATQAETDTGTNDTKAVTPLKLVNMPILGDVTGDLDATVVGNDSHTHAAGNITGTDAGTDLTADLEEESEIGAVVVSGTPADDRMIVGASATTAAWQVLPAGGTDGCSAAGDKPIYIASTNSWDCGTDGGGTPFTPDADIAVDYPNATTGFVESVEDLYGAATTSNTETHIAVDYDDADGTIDYVVNSATTSVIGAIEVATTVEVTAGTSETLAVSPGTLNGADLTLNKVVIETEFALGDGTLPLFGDGGLNVAFGASRTAPNVDGSPLWKQVAAKTDVISHLVTTGPIGTTVTVETANTTFFRCDGANSGVIASIADQSTVRSITSYTDQGGSPNVVRIVLGNAGLGRIGEEFLIDGTTGDVYEGYHTIVGLDNSTYFDIESADLGNPATKGTWNNQIRVSDTAHGLVAGDTILIDSATDYNKYWTVEDAVADTFDLVGGQFTVTRTGNWTLVSQFNCGDNFPLPNIILRANDQITWRWDGTEWDFVASNKPFVENVIPIAMRDAAVTDDFIAFSCPASFFICQLTKFTCSALGAEASPNINVKVRECNSSGTSCADTGMDLTITALTTPSSDDIDDCSTVEVCQLTSEQQWNFETVTVTTAPEIFSCQIKWMGL